MKRDENGRWSTEGPPIDSEGQKVLLDIDGLDLYCIDSREDLSSVQPSPILHPVKVEGIREPLSNLDAHSAR
jgi:hypothetical protein